MAPHGRPLRAPVWYASCKLQAAGLWCGRRAAVRPRVAALDGGPPPTLCAGRCRLAEPTGLTTLPHHQTHPAKPHVGAAPQAAAGRSMQAQQQGGRSSRRSAQAQAAGRSSCCQQAHHGRNATTRAPRARPAAAPAPQNHMNVTAAGPASASSPGPGRLGQPRAKHAGPPVSPAPSGRVPAARRGPHGAGHGLRAPGAGPQRRPPPAARPRRRGAACQPAPNPWMRSQFAFQSRVFIF
ncbi:Protein of unknown function [Gryllus bimaculatus]|nr:Protein of unknown function [Gryllus bimaculatus]